MKYKIFLIVGIIFLIGIISSSTYYVTNPVNCPSSDGTNFPGQNCAPQDICGDISGIAQCDDTSTITPPGSSSTTTGSGGTDYSCSDTTCSGGFITNCYAATNCLTALVDRNATCYNKHVQTTATASVFNQSSCSATCTTNYFACDTDTTDADGCEIHAGDSCGSATGTIVFNQCYSTSAGNCTSSTRLDCDDSDSDGNPATCNVGNGCEILIGGTCNVGSLTGTYGSACTGSAGTCVLTPQHFITSVKAEYQSNTTHPFLWGVDYFLGNLLNLSWNGGGGIYVNTSGIHFNGTRFSPDTDTFNTTQQMKDAVNNSGYYNITANNSIVWNNTIGMNMTQFQTTGGGVISLLQSWLKTWADTLYVALGTKLGNTTAEIQAAETDPNWGTNKTNYYNQTVSNATYLKLTGGNITGNVNITNSNLSISNLSYICMNTGCSRWMMSNNSGVYIQG